MVWKTTSDVGYYVWVAQQLNKMSTPWSHNFMINAPTGVPFWSPATTVNGIYWLILWVLTRVLAPIVAVNLILLAGWILSGVSAFIMAKWLGARYSAAIVSGISLEMLPWVREKLIVHPLYVFWFVPIFVMLAALKFLRETSFKNLVILASCVCMTFFVDLYWFWFTFDLVVVVLLVNAVHCGKSWMRWAMWQRISSIASITAFPILVYKFYGLVQQRTLSSISWERPLEISSPEFINIFQGSINRFFTTPPEHLFVKSNFLLGLAREDIVNYAGISLVLLSLVAIWGMGKQSTYYRRGVFTTWAAAVVFAILTLPTSYTVLGLNLGKSVDILRIVNPGVRVFSRTGMISQAMLCVLAGVGVSKIATYVRWRRTAVLVLLILISADLNPLARRLSNADYVSYTHIREELSQSANPVVLEIWPALNRWYFPRYYIDSPNTFTWLEYNNRSSEVRLQASLGIENFYRYLISRDVTHVLIPRDSDNVRNYWAKWSHIGAIDLEFDSKYFDEVASADGDVPATLFKLQQRIQGDYCRQCQPYQVEWSGVRYGFVGMNRSAQDLQSYYEDGARISWAHGGESPSFKISSSDAGKRSFNVSISMVPAFGPMAPPQIVSIQTKESMKVVKLSVGIQTEVNLTVSSGEVVSFRTFLPCVVPSTIEPGNTDQRQLCFGVTNFSVSEVVS